MLLSITKEIPEFLGALCQDHRRPNKYLLSDDIIRTYFSLWKLLESPHPCSGSLSFNGRSTWGPFLVSSQRISRLLPYSGQGSLALCSLLTWDPCPKHPSGSQTQPIGGPPVWVVLKSHVMKLNEDPMEKKMGSSQALAVVPPCGTTSVTSVTMRVTVLCPSPEGTMSTGANGGLLTHEQNCLSHQFHIVTSESLG